MKKTFIKIGSIFLCICCFFSIGCKKEEPEGITANQKVGSVKYYVPKDYEYRKDLKGLLYSEDERKVFAKGNTTDYNTFYYIDMIKNNSNGKKLSDYISDVNSKNLKDGDVKFKKIDNENLEVYGREGYIIKQNNIETINYAYITQADDFFYGLTISGPKANQKEVEEIAKSSANSLIK